MEYREKALSLLALELAGEDMGIYPASIVENGVSTKRTEWQDGWNAYGLAQAGKRVVIAQWLKGLPDEYKAGIQDYLLNEKLFVRVDGKELKLWVLCNDLFYWACGDCEDFEFSDLPEFQKALQESPKNGDLLWVCRKRKMRPQQPYYEYFTEQERALFDAAGPERTDA